MKKAPAAWSRIGAASVTTKAASWSRSATTWIWATPGNGPTIPRYAEKWASLAYRIAMNYFVYDLTH